MPEEQQRRSAGQPKAGIRIQLPGGIYTYHPDQPLGQAGGFGQVFAGRTADGVDVAVKRLHVSASEAAHRELRIAGELCGRVFDHVLPFMDSGEDAETGRYFLVMPRAAGDLHAEITEAGSLADGPAAQVLLEIAAGLSEVSDLVHRDLKPANILKHDGRWKVADFGIARFAEDATSLRTLRDCLTPAYAAPEQLRRERSTHATDVYSLGCIGFFLLHGHPPFTRDPQEEHCQAPVPPMQCEDPRLESLLRMMLRKLPETRPALSRVLEILRGIVEVPARPGASDSSGLAAASAAVATEEDERQSEEARLKSAQDARKALSAGAWEILKANMERLWGKIHASAPAATREPRSHGHLFACTLGRGRLLVVQPHEYVAENAFAQSRWDVFGCAEIHAQQRGTREYDWSASLWFARLTGSDSPRWHEVAYMSSPLSGRTLRFEPFACSQLREADEAASRIMGILQIAFGPAPVDDEDEATFHDRWMWLLAQAATGELQHPTYLPVRGWPPR